MIFFQWTQNWTALNLKVNFRALIQVVYKVASVEEANRLFMCQDEDENEPEDEFFRSFRIKTVTNEPGPQYYDTLKDRFVRHAQVPERTKALVFVFVLTHEQAISI